MTTARNIVIDMDTVKLIAAAAAREAVDAMREQNREDAERLEQRLEDKLKSYFGGTPGDHVVQHARLDKLLNFVDSLGNNIFSVLIKNLLIGLGVMGLIGYVIWMKLVG